MKGKIGLEEHFAIEDTIMDSHGFLPEEIWPELKSRLLDVQEKRLGFMDKFDMEMMILSLNAPAIQANNTYDIQIHQFRSPVSSDKVSVYQLANKKEIL